MSLKVCIDCSPLLVRSAGVKTYLHHWLRALRGCSPESIATFLEPRDNEHLDHAASESRHFLQLATLWALNRTRARFVSRFVPESSVFHVSNLLRRFPRGPKLSATVHDLTTWVVPQFHTPVQRSADEAFAGVLRSADGLICVSGNSRRDAERILRLDPDKMTVIYPGVPDSYFNVEPRELEAAATALNLRTPYFLFVSTIEPRKNLDGLLSAWLSLPVELRRSHELVVAGMPGWRSETTLKRLRQLAAEASGVRYLGYVPEPLMPGLTAGARALIYPSFYEGFGIPVAQALAAGCPVIASGVSSLPEVTGDAGLMVDPGSQDEIASAIRRISESDSLCDRLRLAGRERAKLFLWERAARQSLDYFRALAG